MGKLDHGHRNYTPNIRYRKGSDDYISYHHWHWERYQHRQRTYLAGREFQNQQPRGQWVLSMLSPNILMESRLCLSSKVH